MNQQSRPKMTQCIIAAFALFSTALAQADCKEAYNNEIKRLDGMLNPARTTMAVSGATAIAVPVTLVATGAVVTAAGIVAAPAAVAGAGIFYAYIGGRKMSLKKALTLIKNAEKGEGPVLARFVEKLQKQDASITQSEVASAIVGLNKENAFCSETKLGRSKAKGFLKVKKAVKNSLSLEDEQSETALEDGSEDITSDFEDQA